MAADGVAIAVELTLGSLRLSAAFDDHDAIGLIGPSGAGKSTLLRVIAGLERRATGTVTYRSECWQDSARSVFVRPHRRGAAWVPQDALLFPHLSVAKNLGYGGATLAEIADCADRLGIASLLARMPRHLSGGERQRVSLGRAMLARPRLLLLDEPFAALDKPLRTRLGGVVADWARAHGTGVVIVSHDEVDAAAFSAKVFAVHGGRLEPRA